MYCIIKCIVQGKQARVKNANLRHPSSMCKEKACSESISNVILKTARNSDFYITYFIVQFIPLSYFILKTDKPQQI